MDGRLAYCGRFAPSPSGPLHFGSVVAALGSYLAARSRGGRWLVRIEDIDPPREMAGAADQILTTLEKLGLTWDGQVVYQSTNLDRYQQVLTELQEQGLVYGCGCTRKEVGPGIYPGTCRNGMSPGRKPRTLRLRLDNSIIEYTDRIQGQQRYEPHKHVGDFVVRRGDGYIAYNLAVTIDDIDQGVSEVVRGADLLDTTAGQIYLQRLLGAARPSYAHLPVATDAHGRKLSKQYGAQAIDDANASQILYDSLNFLGQAPPTELRRDSPIVLRDWAIAHWDIDTVPKDSR